MNPTNPGDVDAEELATRLRRLSARSLPPTPSFDYEGMVARRAAAERRAQRRAGVVRGAAFSVVFAALIGSAWRLAPLDPMTPVHAQITTSEVSPRLVRADSYLALAAIEDHIASIDDALSDARLTAGPSAEVLRLERTRAELLDSYARVQYAERLSVSY